MDRGKKRKRTLSDKLITVLNSARYSVFEKIQLQLARSIHSKEYEVEDENPLVTVYTPTYNRGHILVERALPSVLSQTYKNIEYLIIGDCCTDNTEELVSKFKDPRIRFYNLPEKGKGFPQDAEGRWLAGPVIPANKALELARGKWIARLDDDDVFTPDHVEQLLRFAQAGDYEFVSALYMEERFGKRSVVDGVKANDPYYTRKPLPGNDTSPKIGGTQTWLYRSYLRFFKYNINCWRKAWNRVNDVDLCTRMYKAGVKMGFLDKIVTYVIPRPGEKTVGLEAYLIAEKEGYAVHS